MKRRGLLVVLVSLVVAALTALVAAPASAHSAATGSSPENGSSIDSSPGTVSVTFNENLQDDGFAVLVVVGPDGHYWHDGEPTIDGRTISVPVGELGPTGEYKVNYRVTSADGHPVQGQRTFTLTQAGDGTPGPVADDVDTTGDGDGFPVWAIVVIVVVVLLVLGGAAAAVLARRRS